MSDEQRRMERRVIRIKPEDVTRVRRVLDPDRFAHPYLWFTWRDHYRTGVQSDYATFDERARDMKRTDGEAQP